MIHGDILGERARISPEATALVEVSSGRRFSYRELDSRAVACAAGWRRQLGLEPNDRIALLSANRVEFVECFFAAAKSGVILVPLNTRLAVPELAGILTDSGARALIFDGAHAEQAQALAAAQPELKMVALDGDGPADSLSYSALDGAIERESLSPEHPHCLLYTSGTTGTPKGVIIPHRMTAWNGFTTTVAWQLSAQDVSPIFTPLYHAGGLGAFLVPILTAGGTVVLHRAFDATEVWRTISEEGCTVVLGVPTIWSMLAEAPEFATADLSQVRWFISGGAPLPRHLIELYRERGIILRQGYGMTEVGVNCFTMNDDEAWAKAGSIGRPIPYLETRVAGPDNSDLGPNEVGELCFRGPAVSPGYWNNPEATLASRDEEGWFHTGDMVSRDEDGFYSIAGRAKDLFISGGVNVYPVEIENQLLQHPDLADAAVCGIPHPTWGEVGVAFVVPVEGRSVEPESLEAFLADRLAKFKIPKHWMVRDDLPRTEYGKVIKPELVRIWDAQSG